MESFTDLGASRLSIQNLSRVNSAHAGQSKKRATNIRIPKIKTQTPVQANPSYSKLDDLDLSVMSPFKERKVSSKPKEVKKPRKVSFDDEEEDLEEQALEKLITDNDPFRYEIIFEMFEHKELEQLIKRKLELTKPNKDRYYKLQLLWIDWLIQDQRYSEAERLLNELEQHFDEQDVSEIHSQILLAIAKVHTKCWKLAEANDYLEKALNIAQQHDQQSERILDIKREMGIVYFYQAKYNDAIDNFKRCLAGAMSKLGDDHPWIISVCLDIAFVYEQQWSLNEALRLGKEALVSQKRFFKTTTFQMAKSYDLIGSVYLKQGLFQDAIKAFDKSLGILRKYRHKKHLDCLKIYVKIANAYLKVGNLQKAIDIIQTCLKTLEAKSVKDDPIVSKTYFLQGTACFYTRKFYDAIISFTKSWAINSRIFGPKHPSVANDYQVIGRALTVQGRYREASEMLQKSLDIIREIFGENSFEMGKFYESIGLNYLFQGELVWSLKSYQKCLLIQERCLARDHHHLAMPYCGIARVYQKWGQIDRALLNFEKSLDLWRLTFGNCHPKVASNYADIGSCYTEMEVFDKALEYYMKALLSGYSAPTRHPNFEKATLEKQRDAQMLLTLMTSLNV